MTIELIIAVVIAVIGSTGLFTFLQFLISRNDKKKEHLDDVHLALKELRKDTTRTQLMMLFTDYPEQHDEIMTLAEFYFHNLGGNWYMSTLFSSWLQKEGLVKPSWFNR